MSTSQEVEDKESRFARGMKVLENFSKKYDTGTRYVGGVINTLTLPLTIPTITLIGKMVRESPHQDDITRLGDFVNPARIDYWKKDMTPEELKRELDKFSSGKAIWRRKYYPAGEGPPFYRTEKKTAVFNGGEELWNFVAERIPTDKFEMSPCDACNTDKESVNPNYGAIMRDMMFDRKWLHVTSGSWHWAQWYEVDVIGKRR